MSLADVIRRMAEAGAPAEAIAIAVEAIEAAGASAEQFRASARERKRRQRDREREAVSRDSHAHDAGQERDHPETVTATKRDGHTVVPLALPLSPQTPLTPTHTPPESSTRAKAPSRLAKSNGFARFWEAYPNKVGKAAAEKSYDRAVAKIGGDDPLAVILTGLDRAKASRPWREGYIPHPTTWLNQGRWDDQPNEQAPNHDRTRPHHANDHDSRAEARSVWGEAFALSRGGGSG